MYSLKMFLSAATLAALSSLPVAAQQTMPSANQAQPGNTGAQNSPQTQDVNHSDPTAATQNQPTNAQQPPSAHPDPGAGQGTGQTAPNASGGQNSAAGQSNSSEAVPVPHTSGTPEVQNPQLRPVSAELVKALDSASAKAGDEVTLRTMEEATLGDGVVIPKGSRITGQVVDAKPHDDAHKNGQLTLMFSKVELQSGQSMPIQSLLQTVDASGSAASSDAANGGGSAASGMGNSGAAASSSSPDSGAMPGTPSGTSGANQVGGSQGAPSSTGSAASGGPASADRGPAPGTVVAQQGAIQIKTTSIPGVLVETNAEGRLFKNASGALVGANRNVTLEGGTHVVLGVQSANRKPQSNQ